MRRGLLAFVTMIALISAGVGGVAGRGLASAQDDVAFGANPIGEPVTISNADGVAVAEVTVTEVIDPFEDYEEFSAPAEDERFVLAVIEVANTGERPYEFTQYDFYVLDSLGRAASADFSSRTEASLDEYPDLASANMNAGETVSGALVYRVAADADLVQVYYSFSSDVTQLYLLADLTGLAGDADDDGVGTPVADGDADSDADAAETPATDGGGDASAADCDWGAETLDRLNSLQPVGEELQGMDDDADPERLYEIADDLAVAATDQRDSDPPPFADDANERIADALDLYASALEAVADAIDAGETPDTVALLADVGAANDLIGDAAAVTGPLLQECGLS